MTRSIILEVCGASSGFRMQGVSIKGSWQMLIAGCWLPRVEKRPKANPTTKHITVTHTFRCQQAKERKEECESHRLCGHEEGLSATWTLFSVSVLGVWGLGLGPKGSRYLHTCRAHPELPSVPYTLNPQVYGSSRKKGSLT